MKGVAPEQEAIRVEALRRYHILDTFSEKAFDDLVRLSAQICGTPVALLSFIDSEREWIKSKVGTKVTAFPCDISFCAHVILERDLLIVRDALFDERFATNPLVTSDPNVRFYAGAPLFTPEGLAIGALCIIDRYPRELNSIQAEALRILSRQVMAQLELKKQAVSPDFGRREGDVEPLSKWVPPAAFDRSDAPLVTTDPPELERVKKELKATEELLQIISRATNDSIWDWDLLTDKLRWNEGARTLFRYPADEVGSDVGWWEERIHPDDRKRVLSTVRHVIERGGQFWSDEYRFLRGDGSYADILDRGYVVHDGGNKPVRMIGAMIDISERKQAEDAVRKSEAKNRALLNAIPDLIFRVDHLGRLLDFKSGREFGPKTEPDLPGRKLEDVFPGDLAEQALYHANQALLTSEAQLFEYQLSEEGRARDYEARIVVSGENEVLAIVRDITEKKAQAAILEHQALYDALTDLPNRTLLHDRLQQAILVCHREKRPLALLLMDLDHFKEVNDTLGHHFGDILLRHLGGRLREVLRESDTIARLGGDEFAVLLPTAGTRENAVVVATKILKALEAPFVLEGQTLYVGASIGIALYPTHGEYADLLMQRADVAMYVAKQSGTGYATYSVEADQNSLRKLALKGELRQAIDEGGLFVLYQPKIDLQAARVAAVEALVRWRHPQLGVIPPDQFITLAEHAGLIKPLTVSVLNAALRQCRSWHDAGLEMNVAVNLSVRNLQDPQLPDQIAGILEKYGVLPGRLELEITESIIMADPSRAMDVLTRLDKMGVGLSIDDFGTGYSSLGYLKKLPVEAIKIDKSFIKEMVIDRDDAMIVRSTIDLGHNLGLKVVAEGVENQETWTRLLDLGCDMAQGYYISRPIPADELTQWLSNSPMGLRRV